MIAQFVGANAFLSNFHPSPIVVDGIEFHTVEHAFQAAKTNDRATKEAIAQKATPGAAKRAGGKRGIIKDFDHQHWETIKVETMLNIVRLKFQNPTLRDLLIATGDQRLEEGNIWNDTFWGISLKTKKGQNHLGKILEKVRAELKG